MTTKETTIEIPLGPERTISLTKKEAISLQRELNSLFPVANSLSSSEQRTVIYGPVPFPTQPRHSGGGSLQEAIAKVRERASSPECQATARKMLDNFNAAQLPALPEGVTWQEVARFTWGYECLTEDVPTQHGE